MSYRLDAFLAHAGLGSRTEVRRLIKRRRIMVNGTTCRVLDHPLSDGDEVVCDGEPVVLPPATVHLLVHKPVGYACSHDPREAPLLDDLLDPLWRRAGVEPAGRLDRQTSGLLFCSTDGGLIHRLIHPRRKVAKRYRIAYSGDLVTDAIARCAAGFPLAEGDRPTRPADLQLDGPGQATLILHEGRFHQVRRMIATLGGVVTALHRDRIGQLELPADLAPGQVRPASAAELAALQDR